MSLPEGTPASTAPQSPTAWTAHSAASDTSVDNTQDGSVHASHEPGINANDIAIVGMACRVPGSNNSTDALWAYLLQKGDASGAMPEMRWAPYHSRHPANAGVLARTTSTGYFLDRLEDFDGSFFAVSPREAEQMDPQQRIVLEVAWEALEDAGVAADRLAGSDTAVFVGVNSDDYGKLILEDLENVGAHMGVGTAYCGIPSRVSYHLDLLGPSIAVDAACASSLVAVHNARQALLAGETELALAGGVNALIGPGLTRVLDEAGAIAADGKCRSFDDSAHGYGRGEGAGMVVMKRLAKALADGDRIHGVLKGSAVCADGKTVGIMAPNAAAQQLVARKALSEAKTPAETISYVEAHATSTPLGDPTEMSALAEIYGRGVRQPGSSHCQVGSIKSNIGHLEAAAGVMGLIKAVMVLQHGLVPGQANLETLSTKIDWANNGLKVHKDAAKLMRPSSGHPARAAIASYGYSGTVSHAIIEASPAPRTRAAVNGGGQTEGTTGPQEEKQNEAPVLLMLSGPQQNRLPKAAKALAQWLESTAGVEASLQQVATTLASRRSHHRFRAAIAATTKAEAISALNKLAEGQEDKHIATGRIATSETTTQGVVWIFSGHGAQWPAMGKELMAMQPLFAEVVRKLEPIAQKELGFSVLEAFAAGRMDNSDEIQVMTFAMHVGLAAVLLDQAGPPAAIVGHSLGETSASVVAGALSFDEGARIVCSRARLYRRHMGKGAMALVSIGADEMREKLTQSGQNGHVDVDVDVAIDASPTSCVIAGPTESVAKLSQELKDEGGIQVLAVRSDMAFHSRTLLDLADPLRECLQGQVCPRTPTIRLYSTSALDARSTKLRDIEYWVNNMVAPVRLRGAVKALAEDGYRAFVEVSSHPIVAHSVHDTLEDFGLSSSSSDALVLPTMLREKPAAKQILDCVAKLHCAGFQTAYTKLDPARPWLPGVPGTIWKHEPYWRTVAKVPLGRIPAHKPENNNLLGSRTAVWGTSNVLYQTNLDENTRPYPGRHPLHGSEIVPAAVLVNTFLHAIDTSAYCLEGISLKVPVVISPMRQLQILVSEQQVTLTSRLAESGDANGNDNGNDKGGAWLVNTTSRVAPTAGLVRPANLVLSEIKSRLRTELPNAFSIDYLAKVGVAEMGFPWAVVSHIALDDAEMLATVETNPDGATTAGLNDLGASIMDAATSIASTIFFKEPLLRMPTAVDRVVLHGSVEGLKKGYVHCKRSADKSKPFAVDVLCCDEDGKVLVEFVAMAFAGLESDQVSRKGTGGLVHRLAWPPASFAETPLGFRHVALFSTEESNLETEGYAKQLNAQGYTTSLVGDVKDLASLDASTIVVHLAHRTTPSVSVYEAASASCASLVAAAQIMASSKAKLFSLVPKQQDPATLDLAYAPLYGLARIMNSELSDIFGGLFETAEDGSFPMTAIKYVQGEDVVRTEDGVPRVARLRPFPDVATNKDQPPARVSFSPGGTYLITGGLGALGLEVAKWMVGRGARRLLLVSRRQLPRRADWKDASPQHKDVLASISALEASGATVHVLPVDMSQPSAAATLSAAIDALSLPPVTGVVHAAGVLEDQNIEAVTKPAFDAVLAPKLLGALALDELFPPGSVESFTLFSSCGQLLGFPGQASYASANACLDALAERRRARGDGGALAILWTSWRGLGMAASTEYINAELEAKGISDVTAEEAFLAWDRIAGLDTSQAVVLRALPVGHDEEAAHPILADIAPRRPPPAYATGGDGGKGSDQQTEGGSAGGRPSSGPELEKYILDQLNAAVASSLGVAKEDVDPSVALSEMGMDSVITVSFRTRVQKALKVKMAPTLVWKCPTVGHLVKHFAAEMQK